MPAPAPPSPRRWLILMVGLWAQTATCVFLYGLPLMLPEVRRPGGLSDAGLSLSGAGVVVAAPSLGLLLMLIAWGVAADRFGERLVMSLGLGLATAALAAGAAGHGPVELVVALILAGAGAASVSAASGRMVLGWFGPGERGLAMGVRQTGQPLGVALAALTLPPVARAWGVHGAIAVTAALCASAAVLVVVATVDPPRPAAVGTPPPAASTVIDRPPGRTGPVTYREAILWRIHAASAALVVPQFVISAFTLAYLVTERNWSSVAAGRLIFVFQVAGAIGRIGAGVWSDRVGSRLRPMRALAVASATLMLLLAVCDLSHAAFIVAVFAAAAIVTVADNGLAFTSVAEMAGTRRAGRALGVQNTGQNITAALTPPLLGALITAHGFAVGFVAVALFPLAAVFLTPVVRAESIPEVSISRG